MHLPYICISSCIGNRTHDLGGASRLMGNIFFSYLYCCLNYACLYCIAQTLFILVSGWTCIVDWVIFSLPCVVLIILFKDVDVTQPVHIAICLISWTSIECSIISIYEFGRCFYLDLYCTQSLHFISKCNLWESNPWHWHCFDILCAKLL